MIHDENDVLMDDELVVARKLHTKRISLWILR